MIPSRGWYQWAWSPVIGCKHGCEYCYCHGMFDNFDVPRLNVKALTEPEKYKKPSVSCELLSICDLTIFDTPMIGQKKTRIDRENMRSIAHHNKYVIYR